MANRALINPQILTDIADAIRSKTGTDGKIKPTDMAMLILSITSTEGGGSGEDTTTVLVESITIDNIDNLFIGESVELGITVSPSNATDKTYTITSTNNSVVSVDENTITAKAVGGADINIVANDGGGASATISVVVVDGVTLNSIGEAYRSVVSSITDSLENETSKDLFMMFSDTHVTSVDNPFTDNEITATPNFIPIIKYLESRIPFNAVVGMGDLIDSGGDSADSYVSVLNELGTALSKLIFIDGNHEWYGGEHDYTVARTRYNLISNPKWEWNKDYGYGHYINHTNKSVVLALNTSDLCGLNDDGDGSTGEWGASIRQVLYVYDLFIAYPDYNFLIFTHTNLNRLVQDNSSVELTYYDKTRSLIQMLDPILSSRGGVINIAGHNHCTVDGTNSAFPLFTLEQNNKTRSTNAETNTNILRFVSEANVTAYNAKGMSFTDEAGTNVAISVAEWDGTTLKNHGIGHQGDFEISCRAIDSSHNVNKVNFTDWENHISIGGQLANFEVVDGELHMTGKGASYGQWVNYNLFNLPVGKEALFVFKAKQSDNGLKHQININGASSKKLEYKKFMNGVVAHDGYNYLVYSLANTTGADVMITMEIKLENGFAETLIIEEMTYYYALIN